jgi:predicted flap endonuclease-1-like 5' DNA nuclease
MERPAHRPMTARDLGATAPVCGPVSGPVSGPVPALGADRERLARTLAARRAEQAALRARRAERLARIRARDPEGRPLALLAPAGAPKAELPSPEPQTPEPQTPEPQTPERQTPERQTPERQTPERPAVGPRTAGVEAPDHAGDTALTASAVHDGEALERLLTELIGILEPAPEPEPDPAAVLCFPRTAEASDPAGSDRLALPGAGRDLFALPGVGPGLVAALVRAGVPDLATLAALDPDALAARLGPLGRLVDPDLWIAAARAATRT